MPILIFLSVLCYYIVNAFPSLASTGSGGIALASWSLGAFPGEDGPLLILCGKIALWAVPFGNPAYRLNVFAAVMGAGAAVLLAGLLNRFVFRAEAVGGLLPSLENERWRKTCVWLAGLFWALRLGQDGLFSAFSAPAFYVTAGLAVLTLLVTPLGPGKKPARATALIFTLCLGSALAPPILFLSPGIVALWAAVHAPLGAPARRSWIRPLILFLFGAGLGFSAHWSLSERGLSPLMHVFGDAQSWQTGARLAQQAQDLWRLFTPVGLGLALWGAYVCVRRTRALFQALAALWLVSGPLLGSFTPAPGWTALATVPLFLWAAMGLYEMGIRWPMLRKAALAMVPVAMTGAFLTLSRGDLLARDLGANMLNSLPPESVVWNPSRQILEPLRHQLFFHAARPDIKVLAEPRRHFLTWRLPTGAEYFQRKDFLERLVRAPWDVRVFSDEPGRLPGFSSPPHVSQALRSPRDVFPTGLAARFFPAAHFRLSDPMSQLSWARVIFWWYRQATPWRATSSQGRRSAPARCYADAHALLAEKFAENKILDMAELENQLALAIDPRHPRALKSLGEAALAGQEPSRAAVYLTRALAQQPRDGDICFLLAQAISLQGRPRDALPLFEKAADLLPGRLDVYPPWAGTLEQLSRWEAAIAVWKKLREKTPDDKNIYWRLAHDYAAMQNFSKAREALGDYFLLPLTVDERAEADALQAAWPGSVSAALP